MRKIAPDQSPWGLTELLLAELVDVQRWIAWSKTKDGQNNRNRPERITRPGVEPQKQRAAENLTAFDIDTVKQKLAAPRV